MLTINRQSRKPLGRVCSLKPVIDSVGTLSKREYDMIVSEKREDFMLEHFYYDLERIFQELRTKAGKMMQPLSHTITIHIQDHFDIQKVSKTISSYFQDLGYTVSFEPLKDGNNDVCFILS